MAILRHVVVASAMCVACGRSAAPQNEQGVGGNAAGGQVTDSGDPVEVGVDSSNSTALPECSLTGAGGGDACGGVFPDVRVFHGTGFDAYEGATVVGELGVSQVSEGRFSLYIGTYAGCGPVPTVYRLDLDGNGRCDEGEDLIYEYPGNSGFVQSVDASAPGSEATCAMQPAGYDLQLQVDGADWPTCGDLGATLYQGDTALAGAYIRTTNLIGYGFAGLLTPGESYQVRYVWTNGDYADRCSSRVARGWVREFIAQDGLNVLELANTDPEGGDSSKACPPWQTCLACDGIHYCVDSSWQCLRCEQYSYIATVDSVCPPCPEGYAEVGNGQYCYPP